ARRDHFGGDAGERVALAPGRFFFFAAVAERAAGVGAVLVEVAVDLNLDDGGTPTAAQHLLRLLCGQVDRQRVHAVDPPRGDAEPEPAGGEPGFAGRFVHLGGHGVEVVLDEEAQWQLPRRSEVHRFEHGADVHGTVTEIAHGVVRGSSVLLRPGVARAEGYAPSDDRIGP